eukprot:3178113-Rhodomonas_salina.4
MGEDGGRLRRQRSDRGIRQRERDGGRGELGRRVLSSTHADRKRDWKRCARCAAGTSGRGRRSGSMSGEARSGRTAARCALLRTWARLEAAVDRLGCGVNCCRG